jgi:hypothetical protein
MLSLAAQLCVSVRRHGSLLAIATFAVELPYGLIMQFVAQKTMADL